MAEPLYNGAAYQSVPESYVLPADKRPGSLPSSAAAIPVVDLGGDDPDRIVKQIMDAGREFGFFQVNLRLNFFLLQLPFSLNNCLI